MDLRRCEGVSEACDAEKGQLSFIGEICVGHLFGRAGLCFSVCCRDGCFLLTSYLGHDRIGLACSAKKKKKSRRRINHRSRGKQKNEIKTSPIQRRAHIQIPHLRQQSDQRSNAYPAFDSKACHHPPVRDKNIRCYKINVYVVACLYSYLI